MFIDAQNIHCTCCPGYFMLSCRSDLFLCHHFCFILYKCFHCSNMMLLCCAEVFNVVYCPAFMFIYAFTFVSFCTYMHIDCFMNILLLMKGVIFVMNNSVYIFLKKSIFAKLKIGNDNK